MLHSLYGQWYLPDFILCLGSDHTLKGCYYIRQGEAYVILFNGFVGHMAHLKAGDYFGEHNLHKIGL